MTVQQYKLNNEFKKRNLIALLGCGSTPGISNVMAAYAVSKVDSVDHIDLGFAWNSNIKEFVLPYSIESIVYELTTTPIVLENSRFKKIRACLPEGKFEFFGIGRQDTYCIVHSEVFTFNKYFKNKGLKSIHYKAGFPEHSFKALNLIIGLGFGSKDKININGVMIRPIDFTRAVLKKIEAPKNYKEKEDIWVQVDGMKDGKVKKIEMNCFVETKKGWGKYNSNIDTGMTISIMGQMIKNGLVSKTGVTAPETVIPEEEFFKQLKKRGMKIYLNNKELI